MIKEHYIDLYLASAARTINKVTPGDGIICMSPLPTGATIYFDDETTRALPFLSDIPIYRNFKEFTIYLPTTEYILSLADIINPAIRVVVVTKPHCLPSVPQNRIYIFSKILIAQHGAWINMPHNNRKIRISSNSEDNSNWRTVEIRSLIDRPIDKVAPALYSILGYMCFYKAGSISPVCEFGHVEKLGIYFAGTGGTGCPKYNFEVFT